MCECVWKVVIDKKWYTYVDLARVVKCYVRSAPWKMINSPTYTRSRKYGLPSCHGQNNVGRSEISLNLNLA